MKELEYKILEYDSTAYHKLLELRQTYLRRNIGYPISEEEVKKEKNDIFFAVLDEDEVVGCCILTQLSETDVQLRQMVVHPDYRAFKIGKRLISFVESIALSKQYERIILHARKTAIGFYEKQAYKIFGEEFSELELAHNYMHKILKE